MAALFRQTARLILGRSVLYNTARAGSSSAKKPEEIYTSVDKEVRTSVEAFYSELDVGKKALKKAEPPSDDVVSQLGTLTGALRAELLEELRGVGDPFDVGVHKQDSELSGTFDHPIIVPTTSGERLVGCVCEEDNTDVFWMILYSGLKRKCKCGNWFHCVSIPGAHDH